MSKYLVTGAMGCIGAWTLYHLAKSGKSAVSFDLSDQRDRLDLLMSREEQEAITFVNGDLTDEKVIFELFETHGITHVIHLAALQVPMVRANPILGSRVNVTGTTNIFEACARANVKHLAYASSIAVYGPPELYEQSVLPHDAPMLPHTLYGVFKVANEGTADIYWREHGISSANLRPYTVYGVGRDQGLTSEPTKAMFAVAKGEDYHISFGGKMQFHLASDVAQQFIHVAETPGEGALGFNLGTLPIEVQAVADIINSIVPDSKVTVGDTKLPFPEGFDASALHRQYSQVYETPLTDGIRATIEAFRA